MPSSGRPKRIDDAAEQRLADRHRREPAARDDAVARTNARRVAERHRQQPAVAESRPPRPAAALARRADDFAHFADARVRAVRLDQQTDDADDAARERRRARSVEARRSTGRARSRSAAQDVASDVASASDLAAVLRVGRAASARARGSATSMPASMKPKSDSTRQPPRVTTRIGDDAHVRPLDGRACAPIGVEVVGMQTNRSRRRLAEPIERRPRHADEQVRGRASPRGGRRARPSRAPAGRSGARSADHLAAQRGELVDGLREAASIASAARRRPPRRRRARPGRSPWRRRRARCAGDAHLLVASASGAAGGRAACAPPARGRRPCPSERLDGRPRRGAAP